MSCYDCDTCDLLECFSDSQSLDPPDHRHANVESTPRLTRPDLELRTCLSPRKPSSTPSVPNLRQNKNRPNQHLHHHCQQQQRNNNSKRGKSTISIDIKI